MDPLVIVGLGNPGREYQETRHNVGFLFLDGFKNQLNAEKNFELKKDFKAEIVSTTINDRKALLVKPQTFMNHSGQAVRAILDFYKLAPTNLWVVYDDLDLPLGRAQVRFGGGNAGHHGLESIEQHIRTKNYGRIRIGIRGQELRQHHAAIGMQTNDFVLGKLTSVEKSIFKTLFNEVGEYVAANLGHAETKNFSVDIDKKA